MIALGLWVLMLGVSLGQAPSLQQQTHGWCSPITGQTGGNVTITMNCPGVDPQALETLNKELGLIKGQLQAQPTKEELAQKTLEANQWKLRYEALLRQARATQDKDVGQQAETLVREGKLDAADTRLRQSIISMAQYHAIQPGMTYPEVVKILGRPGVEASSGANHAGYTWQNLDGGMVVVVFMGERVASKTQSGLR